MLTTGPTARPAAVLTIAKRGARGDIEQVRAQLLRLRHDWGQITLELAELADALLNQLDDLDSAIQELAA